MYDLCHEFMGVQEIKLCPKVQSVASYKSLILLYMVI